MRRGKWERVKERKRGRKTDGGKEKGGKEEDICTAILVLSAHVKS